MRKPHYVPVAALPVEFFIEHYSRTFATRNGFTFVEVDGPLGPPAVYIHRGTKLWRRV